MRPPLLLRDLDLPAGRDFRPAAFRAPAFRPPFLAAFRPPDFALPAFRVPEDFRLEDFDAVFEVFFLAPALGAPPADRVVAAGPVALVPPTRPAEVGAEPNALRPAIPAAVPAPNPVVDEVEGGVPP
ncbi:MAG TPA: hypothetical protein VFH13_05130 [Gemmatimonadaceae bacterium]|nr:hypothetical protein [Gemmatimonadaceae bacterium]